MGLDQVVARHTKRFCRQPSLVLSIDAGTVLVGAQFDDDNGNDSGSAYVFDVTACLSVPALSQWGMLALTTLLLSAGAIVLGKRVGRTRVVVRCR